MWNIEMHTDINIEMYTYLGNKLITTAKMNKALKLKVTKIFSSR